jgi:transposase-like protein
MIYSNSAIKVSVREQKGTIIARNTGYVNRIDEHTYKVRSQSSDTYYDVINSELGFLCSCCDHIYRGVKCKHIFAVEFSLNIRNNVQSSIIIKQLDTLSCIFCSSKNFVKDSIRHNKNYEVQRYLCKECNRRFSFNVGFEGARVTPKIITSAMQLYFSGESLRSVQKFFRLQGISISHVAVYKWINKYIGLMEKYLDTIKPNVSSVWRTDELYLKIKGDRKYLFAIMDDETRFWIAQQVSDKKNTSDVRPMFKESIERTGKRPRVLISDGAHNFHLAYKREFFTIRKPRTQHIRDIRVSGEVHNNKMERMNGEIRDREKTMRGLKRIDTSILNGYQIYHNYIREHQALNNETPASRCGIEIEGNDKWKTLIENSSNLHYRMIKSIGRRGGESG